MKYTKLENAWGFVSVDDEPDNRWACRLCVEDEDCLARNLLTWEELAQLHSVLGEKLKEKPEPAA